MRQERWGRAGPIRVTDPTRLVAAALLAMATTATAPALAGTDADAATADDGAGPPLMFCTAPWAPFVVSVPPPLPPSGRPDPLALGFTPPQRDSQDGASPDTTPAATTPDAPVPPEPPAPTTLVEPQVADAGDTAPVQGTAVPREEIPLTGADVAPPMPPTTKILGRILAAQMAAQDALPAGSGTDDSAGVADSADTLPVDGDTGQAATEGDPASVDAAPNPAPGPNPNLEAAPDADADSATQIAATAAAEDETATGVLDMAGSGDPLERLRMPSARMLLPQGRPGGPMTEVVVAACKVAGLNCRISLLPWLRPADLLTSGRCDAVFPVEPDDSTRRVMELSRPLVDSRLAFFTLDTSITRPDQFTDFIVLARGPSEQAVHAHRAVEPLDKTRLVFGPDLPRLIARLGTLRPDDRVALFGNYHVIIRAMSQVEDPLPAVSVVPAGVQHLSVGFARDRVPGPVVRAFNQGLRRLAETRTLQEILDLAGLEPPEQSRP